MKSCLKSIVLAGATALSALALTGCVAPPDGVVYVSRFEPSPIIVERAYPLGYPVIEYRVWPHYGFHNPHTHFYQAPPVIHHRIMPMPQPSPQHRPQMNQPNPNFHGNQGPRH